MAKVIGTIEAQFSGRVGDKVYYKHQGINCVRKAPAVKKDARTPRQLMNQQRFRVITRFCILFKQTLIPQIWNDAAGIRSGYNLFMKANSPAFAKDGSIAEPMLLKFSVGDLLKPRELTVQRTAPDADSLQVAWQKETHITGTRAIDELMVISYDGEKFSPMTLTGLVRKDLQGSFKLPALPPTAGFVYLFFRSEDRRGFSESMAFKI